MLQGKWRMFIIKEYAKLGGDGAISKAISMAAQCPECAKAGHCLECFCTFEEMALSDKKCPKNEKD